VPKVFAVVELLGLILENLDLCTLHTIRRVNSTFKHTIETSPMLRPTALGYNNPEASEVLRHRFFRICPEGSFVFVTHAYNGAGVVFGMTLNVRPLTWGRTERLHGLWEDILLHVSTSGHLDCCFS